VRLDTQFEALVLRRSSWLVAVSALILEFVIAITIGLAVGHPWLAVATAFWGFPVALIFVPPRSGPDRLDRRVLGAGTTGENSRSARFNLLIFGFIGVAIIVAITIALLR
jgi:hypothetical protein